jgi:hypothetical protein
MSSFKNKICYIIVFSIIVLSFISWDLLIYKNTFEQKHALIFLTSLATAFLLASKIEKDAYFLLLMAIMTVSDFIGIFYL